MNGIINVLKPSGMTSHDIVSFIRKRLNVKKVGHTGTLDPNAAGVLPICIGKATKISQYLTNHSKCYRAELTLGIQTDTQDKYGAVINTSNHNVKKEDIYNVFSQFEGEIHQIPPMYSAIRKDGKRLYEIARKGKVIEREPRKVFIDSLNIVNILDNKKIIFDVLCSKGTYIRTLCNDIGLALNTYGCMTFLLRTSVGDFSLDKSYTIEEIDNSINDCKIEKIIYNIDYPLKHLECIRVNEKYYNKIINGAMIPYEGRNQCENNKYRIYCCDKFIGIAYIKIIQGKKYIKMEKVLL